MKCPVCLSEGTTSQVYLLTRWSTLLHAVETYDEAGQRIPNEKLNWTTTQYRCSNGHQWEEKERTL
jgi:hypothetical protein